MRRLALLAFLSLALAGAAIAREPILFQIIVGGPGLGPPSEELVIISRQDGGGSYMAERRFEQTEWCLPTTLDIGCVSKEKSRHDWLDENNCNAFGAAMKELDEAIAAEHDPAKSLRIFHSETPILTFIDFRSRESGRDHGPSGFSERAGPLTDWWYQLRQQTAACWSPNPPERANGRHIVPRLTL